jgi:hypothetical protein
MTQGEVEQLVATLAAAYSASPSEATIAVYVAALSDLEAFRGRRAVEVLIREHDRFPTVSEIRSVASEGGMWGIRGMIADEMEHWEEIKAELAGLGYDYYRA